MSEEEGKKIPRICEELIETYRCYWSDFHQNDIPVFLEYGIIPPEKQKEGLYGDDEYDRRLSSHLVKFHEIHFLHGNRGKLEERLDINLRREHSEDIVKGYEVRPFYVFTCEEALGKGYEKEIQKEIENRLRELSWEK